MSRDREIADSLMDQAQLRYHAALTGKEEDVARTTVYCHQESCRYNSAQEGKNSGHFCRRGVISVFHKNAKRDHGNDCYHYKEECKHSFRCTQCGEEVKNA